MLAALILICSAGPRHQCRTLNPKRGCVPSIRCLLTSAAVGTFLSSTFALRAAPLNHEI
jgi:hypothetical protein